MSRIASRQPTIRRPVLAGLAAFALGLSLAGPASAQDNATPVPGVAATAPESKGEVDVAKLMAPGPLPDVVKGKADAPVTIVEYASMTCPHCAEFAIDTLPKIQKDYIDTGKAKLILREFPFDKRAVAAFMLARCAPEGRRDAMVDVLFQQQQAWAHTQNASQALFDISRLAGFTEESFKACLSDKDLQAKVVATQARGANEFGVEATPTFFINGKRYEGALGAPELAAILDAAS